MRKNPSFTGIRTHVPTCQKVTRLPTDLPGRPEHRASREVLGEKGLSGNRPYTTSISMTSKINVPQCPSLRTFLNNGRPARVKVAVNTIVPRSPFFAFCAPKYRLL